MQHNYDDFQEDDNFSAVVNRYKEMRQKKFSTYFDVEEYENIIHYFVEMDSIDEAFQACEYALSQHPDSTLLLLKNAQLLIDKGLPEKALGILNMLNKYDPQSVDISLAIGSAYCLLGDIKKSTKIFDNALKIVDRDENVDLLLGISHVFVHAGYFDIGLKYLLQAQEIVPHYPSLIYDLAYCYEKVGENEKSISYYLEFIVHRPFSESAWYNLGILYNKTNQFEKAIDAYDYALAISPDYSSAYFNKANTLANYHQYAEALEVYKLYIEIDSGSAQAHCYIAECYEKTDDPTNAIEHYKKALEIDSNFQEAWIGLGVVLYELQQFILSLLFIQKAVIVDESNPEAWFLLGKVSSGLNFIEGAEFAFTKSIELDPYDQDVWIEYSETFINIDKVEEGIKILQTAYKFNSGNAAINYRLAAYLFYVNEHKLALYHLESALEQGYNEHEEFFNLYPDAKKNEQIAQLINRYQNPQVGI